MTTNRIRYNYVFLQEFCKGHNIILLKDYSNENINRDSIIEGKCKSDNCNEKCYKKLREFINTNSYCLNHTKENRKIKVNNTCLERYGVDSVFKSKEVRNKSKTTILEIYGVENISQNEIIKKTKKDTIKKIYGDEGLSNVIIKNKKKDSCLEKYGTEYSTQSQIVKNKVKETCLEKYGVEYASQSIIVKDKMKNTCLEKYGVEYACQSDIMKEKSKNTVVDKYGVENPFQNEYIKEKSKKTCLEKYGVEYSLQSQEIKDKGKQTCLEIYGVEHHTQNSEIMEKCSKNAYKLKDYTLPSGNIIKIQGYEHYALDELLKDGILEEDIINGCKNVPEIWYTDENGGKHRHYVDIFIPSQNRCIEVKSTWTVEKKKDCIYLKQQAGKELGYNYEIWVYNGKGEKIECYK